ncbi:rhomboid family intramembrane serine protease [Tenacibaculum sp. UWU-22]|uniref:rhomboid family intramembrane serine protease n=1 Tax=Tenacibaculum sp. UWU-22 TaxID=3234187 RepID=UPI0034DB31A2
MEENKQLRFTNQTISIPFLLVFICWFVYWLEIKFGWNFNTFGIYPRTFSGLKGVIFAPFIHSDTRHLFNNSAPLIVLLISLFLFYKKVAWKVLLYGTFLTGITTWLIGRPSYHIGASGIIYLLFSFIFFSGIIKKHYRLIALSLIVIFLYGSMIWYVLPIKEELSWEGHLSGFLTGLFFAFLYKKEGIVKKDIEFVKTDFDDLFDENGNFTPNIEEKEKQQSLNYQYFYKEKE